MLLTVVKSCLEICSYTKITLQEFSLKENYIWFAPWAQEFLPGLGLCVRGSVVKQPRTVLGALVWIRWEQHCLYQELLLADRAGNKGGNSHTLRTLLTWTVTWVAWKCVGVLQTPGITNLDCGQGGIPLWLKPTISWPYKQWSYRRHCEHSCTWEDALRALKPECATIRGLLLKADSGA